MEFNTQYNTIFLLIKSSLFQYSVIFSDICGRNVCLCFCRCLFRLVFMFIFVLCLCLFLCFVFVFVSWSFIQWSLHLLFNGHFIFVIDFCLLSLTLRGHKHWISRLCQLWKQFPRVPTVETIVIDFCLCHCLGHKTLKK